MSFDLCLLNWKNTDKDCDRLCLFTCVFMYKCRRITNYLSSVETILPNAPMQKRTAGYASKANNNCSVCIRMLAHTKTAKQWNWLGIQRCDCWWRVTWYDMRGSSSDPVCFCFCFVTVVLFWRQIADKRTWAAIPQCESEHLYFLIDLCRQRSLTAFGRNDGYETPNKYDAFGQRGSEYATDLCDKIDAMQKESELGRSKRVRK